MMICQLNNRKNSFFLLDFESREECMSQEPCTCVNMIMDRFVMFLEEEQNMDKHVESREADIAIAEQMAAGCNSGSLVGSNTSSIRKAVEVTIFLHCLGICSVGR